MTPISGMRTGAAQSPTMAERVLGAPKVQKPEEEERPLKPVIDEYVPEEKREPFGRYWMGRDEDGQPKIYFDDPERADAPEKPEDASDEEKPDAPEEEKPEQDRSAKGPKKKEGKEERCVGNTDKVDREIEKLKKKKEELERRLNTEHDEAKIKDLGRQLAQVERELSQKDNDAYRRQHSTFTQLS